MNTHSVPTAPEPENRPRHPRKVFPTLEEAWDFAVSWIPHRLASGETFHFKDSTRELLYQIGVLYESTEGRGINPLIALVEKIQRESTYILDSTRMVQAIADRRFKSINLSEPKEAYKYEGWDRQQIKMWQDYALYFGHSDPTSHTADDAKDYCEWIRVTHTKDGISFDLLEKTMKNICSLYSQAIGLQLLPATLVNPFQNLNVLQAAGPEPFPAPEEAKPIDISILQELLRTAYREDKDMCLAIALSLLAGLRRVENLNLFLENIYPSARKLKVLSKAMRVVKGKPYAAKTRVVDLCDAALAWIEILTEPGKTGKAVPVNDRQYAYSLRKLRRKVLEKAWGKDGLRETCAIAWQYSDKTFEDRQRLLGHKPGSLVTEDHYEGDSDPNFSAIFEEKLHPKNVLTPEEYQAAMDQIARRNPTI